MTVAPATGWPHAVEPPAGHAAALSDRQVHVWATSLELPASKRDALRGLLSLDERERACRFHFDRDRDRYVAARGRLRLLLGAYTHKSPRDLRFDYGAQGKPRLRDPSAEGALRFNLSHSGDLAVYVMSVGRDVGIDVERLRPVPEMDEIVERWFPDEERRRYAACAGADRERAFFAAWTRREALLKARGDGLAEFGVARAAGWALVTLDPAPGYLAALAVEGDEPAVSCFWADPSS